MTEFTDEHEALLQAIADTLAKAEVSEEAIETARRACGMPHKHLIQTALEAAAPLLLADAQKEIAELKTKNERYEKTGMHRGQIIGEFQEKCSGLETEITRLRAELELAKTALQPFALAAAPWLAYPDHNYLIYGSKITVGDLIRAHTSLQDDENARAIHESDIASTKQFGSAYPGMPEKE